MFCNKCGTENPDAAAFCSKCGHAMAEGAKPSPPPIAQARAPAKAQPKSEKQKSGVGSKAIVGLVWFFMAIAFHVVGTLVSFGIAVGAVAYMAVKLKKASGAMIGLAVYAGFVGIVASMAWVAESEKEQIAEQERAAKQQKMAEAAKAREAQAKLQETANAEWDGLLAKAKERADSGDHAGAVPLLLEAQKMSNVTRSQEPLLVALRDSSVLSEHEEGTQRAVDAIVNGLRRDELESFVKSRKLPERFLSANDAVNRALVKRALEPARTLLKDAEAKEKEAAKRQKEQAKLAEQQAKEKAKADREKRLESQYKVKDTFRLGDFAYAIQDVKKRRCLGGQFTQTCAGQGAVFVLVYFAIRNESKETATVLTDDFSIEDATGNIYRSSSEGNTALVMSGVGKDLALSELHPGIQKDTVTAFMVPAESWDLGLKLIVPEKGLLGAGKATVRLR